MKDISVSDTDNIQQDDKQASINAAIKRDSKWLFIGALAAVVVFFALLAAIFLFRPVSGEVSEGVYGNTNGNLANGGFVAESDGWIYYNGTVDYANNSIYKMRTDGSGKTKLIDGLQSVSEINVADGWIYFVNRGLYKMRTDGTGLSKLADSAFGLCIEGDWLYYSDNYGYINKIRTDGTESTQLNSCYASVVNVTDGWIYYSNQDYNHSLYKIRVDGTDETKLSSKSAEFINVEGDWVYYVSFNEDGRYIYKIRTDGTEETRLADNTVTCINVSGGWVYYGNMDDNLSLHKMRTDGTDDVKLNDNGVSLINITGDWIYYCNLTEHNAFYRIKTDGMENQRVE